MKSKRAFTLIELLVVIGIIAVLMAILVSTISRSRRQASRVVCASNMRQLGMAFLAYAHDNDGYFPQPAPYRGPITPALPVDWVHWQKGSKVTESALYDYLGGKIEVLKCPLGTVPVPSGYPYSYAFNGRFSVKNMRVHKIYRPDIKMMVVEVNSNTIMDGAWDAEPKGHMKVSPIPGGGMLDPSCSVRHFCGREYDYYIGKPDLTPKDARCSIIFADGHYGFVLKEKTYSPAFYDPNFRPENVGGWKGAWNLE